MLTLRFRLLMLELLVVRPLRHDGPVSADLITAGDGPVGATATVLLS